MHLRSYRGILKTLINILKSESKTIFLLKFNWKSNVPTYQDSWATNFCEMFDYLYCPLVSNQSTDQSIIKWFWCYIFPTRTLQRSYMAQCHYLIRYLVESLSLWYNTFTLKNAEIPHVPRGSNTTGITTMLNRGTSLYFRACLHHTNKVNMLKIVNGQNK
jgi:hypothetical protein